MRFTTATFFLLGSLLPVGALADGLEHVKQTIYGMDCAPCAYGVEQGLKGLSGVEQVKVSLNDGYAELSLANDSQATLADIREVIRKNGFTPKTADVHVSGTVIASDDGQVLLKTDAETFALAADKSVLSQLARADSPVTVAGSIAGGDDQPLSITTIE